MKGGEHNENFVHVAYDKILSPSLILLVGRCTSNTLIRTLVGGVLRSNDESIPRTPYRGPRLLPRLVRHIGEKAF